MPGLFGDLQPPAYCLPLLSEVLEISHYPVALVEETGIGYDSELRLAREDQPFHVITHVPEYRPYRLHFLVNGAFKILRVLSTPPAERRLAAREEGRLLPVADHDDLRWRLPFLGEADISNLSAFLYQGTVRQLISMPMDARAERDLAEAIPDHREVQREYLRRQIQDFEPLFSEECRRLAPERLYRATCAMNLAFAGEAAALTGERLPDRLQRSSDRPLGERLRSHLSSARAGYPGDCDVTDIWARELGLDGWFEWVPYGSGSPRGRQVRE